MPSATSTTSDAPLGTFEEQVMLAVVRTGRAPGGIGACGIAVRRELEEVTGCEVAIGAVSTSFPCLPEGSGRRRVRALRAQALRLGKEYGT